MPTTLANAGPSSLPVRTESRAKANLRKPEMAASIAERYRVRVGLAIRRARNIRGWSLKEFAAQMPLMDGGDRDERQIARWESGDERPHFDALLAIEDDTFGDALVMAFAELRTSVEVETIIRVQIKRRAA